MTIAAPQFIGMPRAALLILFFSFQLSAFSFSATAAQFRVTAEANQSAAGVHTAADVAPLVSGFSFQLSAFPETFPAESAAGPCVLGVNPARAWLPAPENRQEARL